MTSLYEEEYKNFLENHDLCDFQQSVEWGKIKEYWKNEIFILLDRNDRIKASISILIRKIPFFGNLMYVPRGPICNIHDEEVLQEITKEIQKVAKKHKAFVIRIEPNVEKLDMKFQNIMEKLGYCIYSDAMDFNEEIQARHNLRLNLKNKTEEEVFQSFNAKTRYNIRLAIKKQVEIKELGIEGIDIFHKLLEETAKRDGFRIRPKEYFVKIFQEFKEQDIKILVAYYQEKPIASIIPVIYGKKMWYLYGASSNQDRNVMPNYLLQWTAIQDAIKKKLEVYDFRGVSLKDGKPDGLYQFKKGFGTDFIELIGEIYLPFKPIKYKLYKIAEKQFKKVNNFFYRISLKK